MKIVVIDDEEMILVVTEKVLTKYGHEVLVASSGEAGLELLKSHSGSVDLVLLDLRMDGMSGMEVFREIRKFETELPVLFSSGSKFDFKSIGLTDDSKFGILEKPYSTSDLLAKVELMITAKA